MARVVSLLSALTVIAAVLVLAPYAGADPPGCFCSGFLYTPQDWAQASTCEGARTLLRDQGYAQMSCPEIYGHCARELVLTADCHFDLFTGMWQVDGYVRYRCWVCVGRPGLSSR